MSHILVNAYLAEIDRLKKVSGKTTEQVVREAFKDLLKAWSKSPWRLRMSGRVGRGFSMAAGDMPEA